jgi:hypothetical protein
MEFVVLFYEKRIYSYRICSSYTKFRTGTSDNTEHILLQLCVYVVSISDFNVVHD